MASASGEPAASLAAALPLATVHATDLTPQFVELGAARAARLGLANMRCQVADGERLEQFGDASCDAVCCCMGLMCAVLLHGPHVRCGLGVGQESLLVSRRGGRQLVAEWEGELVRGSPVYT